MREQLPASESPQKQPPAETSLEKLERLAVHVQQMVKTLDRTNSIAVHQKIDQSFYMQKETELILLKAQIEDALNQLHAIQKRAQLHYHQIYQCWSRDAQWLIHQKFSDTEDPQP